MQVTKDQNEWIGMVSDTLTAEMVATPAVQQVKPKIKHNGRITRATFTVGIDNFLNRPLMLVSLGSLHSQHTRSNSNGSN